jgi:hypothetical protein
MNEPLVAALNKLRFQFPTCEHPFDIHVRLLQHELNLAVKDFITKESYAATLGESAFRDSPATQKDPAVIKNMLLSALLKKVVEGTTLQLDARWGSPGQTDGDWKALPTEPELNLPMLLILQVSGAFWKDCYFMRLERVEENPLIRLEELIADRRDEIEGVSQRVAEIEESDFPATCQQLSQALTQQQQEQKQLVQRVTLQETAHQLLANKVAQPHEVKVACLTSTQAIANGPKTWVLKTGDCNSVGFTHNGAARLTCNKASLVRVSVHVNGKSSADGDHLAVNVNGAAVAKAYAGVNTGFSSSFYLSRLITFKVNDFLEISQQMNQNNLNTEADNYLCLELVN